MKSKKNLDRYESKKHSKKLQGGGLMTQFRTSTRLGRKLKSSTLPKLIKNLKERDFSYLEKQFNKYSKGQGQGQGKVYKFLTNKKYKTHSEFEELKKKSKKLERTMRIIDFLEIDMPDSLSNSNSSQKQLVPFTGTFIDLPPKIEKHKVFGFEPSFTNSIEFYEFLAMEVVKFLTVKTKLETERNQQLTKFELLGNHLSGFLFHIIVFRDNEGKFFENSEGLMKNIESIFAYLSLIIMLFLIDDSDFIETDELKGLFSETAKGYVTVNVEPNEDPFLKHVNGAIFSENKVIHDFFQRVVIFNRETNTFYINKKLLSIRSFSDTSDNSLFNFIRGIIISLKNFNADNSTFNYTALTNEYQFHPKNHLLYIGMTQQKKQLSIYNFLNDSTPNNESYNILVFRIPTNKYNFIIFTKKDWKSVRTQSGLKGFSNYTRKRINATSNIKQTRAKKFSVKGDKEGKNFVKAYNLLLEIERQAKNMLRERSSEKALKKKRDRIITYANRINGLLDIVQSQQNYDFSEENVASIFLAAIEERSKLSNFKELYSYIKRNNEYLKNLLKQAFEIYNSIYKKGGSNSRLTPTSYDAKSSPTTSQKSSTPLTTAKELTLSTSSPISYRRSSINSQGYSRGLGRPSTKYTTVSPVSPLPSTELYNPLTIPVGYHNVTPTTEQNAQYEQIEDDPSRQRSIGLYNRIYERINDLYQEENKFWIPTAYTDYENSFYFNEENYCYESFERAIFDQINIRLKNTKITLLKILNNLILKEFNPEEYASMTGAPALPTRVEQQAPKVKPPIPPIPPKRSSLTTEIIVPKYKANSCFFDSVLVALFSPNGSPFVSIFDSNIDGLQNQLDNTTRTDATIFDELNQVLLRRKHREGEFCFIRKREVADDGQQVSVYYVKDLFIKTETKIDFNDSPLNVTIGSEQITGNNLYELGQSIIQSTTLTTQLFNKDRLCFMNRDTFAEAHNALVALINRMTNKESKTDIDTLRDQFRNFWKDCNHKEGENFADGRQQDASEFYFKLLDVFAMSNELPSIQTKKLEFLKLTYVEDDTVTIQIPLKDGVLKNSHHIIIDVNETKLSLDDSSTDETIDDTTDYERLSVEQIYQKLLIQPVEKLQRLVYDKTLNQFIDQNDLREIEKDRKFNVSITTERKFNENLANQMIIPFFKGTGDLGKKINVTEKITRKTVENSDLSYEFMSAIRRVNGNHYIVIFKNKQGYYKYNNLGGESTTIEFLSYNFQDLLDDSENKDILSKCYLYFYKKEGLDSANYAPAYALAAQNYALATASEAPQGPQGPVYKMAGPYRPTQQEIKNQKQAMKLVAN